MVFKVLHRMITIPRESDIFEDTKLLKLDVSNNREELAGSYFVGRIIYAMFVDGFV